MKTPVVLFLSLSALLSASAQEPTDFRTEQVFLAPRSLSCAPGDSLFVDGMVTCMASDRLEPYSRYLYLELIGDNDSVYVRQKLSCADGGRFSTAVLTEPDMPKGVYYLRGYTRFMRNFDHSAFALQPVAVGIDIPAADYTVDDDVDCRFSVAGGSLRQGQPQRLTAVLSNYAGQPLAFRQLFLTDNKGDTVSSAMTSRAGYAFFDFVPAKGRSYSVRFADEGISKSFKAPEVTPSTVSIKAAANGNRIVFELSDAAAKVKDRRLYVYDRNNGISEVMSPAASGNITLPNAPTGPVTLFLTDGALQTRAETSILPRSRRTASVTTDGPLQAGKALDFKLSGIDTADCRVFARFVPDNALWNSQADQQLVYASDFTSALPFPGVDTDPDSRQADLAAWLENARFTRFRLRDAVLNDSTVYEYYPEFNMEISGTVFDDINNLHPMKQGRIVAFNNSTNAVSDSTLTDGRFRLAVDDFAEGDTFFLQALQGKKNEPVSNGIALDNESFPAAVIDRGRLITSGRYAGDVTTSIGQSSGTVHDLPDVTVKARVIQKSEVPSKAHYEVKMKTREAIERRGYLTLRDILNDMPMLTLTSESFGNGTDNGLQLPVIYSKRGISLLGRRKIGENVGMALVIDGSRIDNDNFDLYLEMSATEIESVEQVSIGEALMYAKTLDGAVIVKTRKWTPDKSVKSKGTIVRPMGLSNIPLASNEKPVVPSKDGDYRLLVDIVGPDGVTSLSRPFTLSTAK